MRLTSFLLYCILMAGTGNIKAQSLDDYQWKNRILLLVDETADTYALTSQLAVLNADKEELADRDLLVFRVTPNAVFASDATMTQLNPKELYADYDLKEDFKGVVLLGKDGGVKMREPFEVKAQRIFALIDGMPMRRREIRESKGN
ncbi:MAG: DUF4174 domain-containing protein [Pricia sp.]